MALQTLKFCLFMGILGSLHLFSLKAQSLGTAIGGLESTPTRATPAAVHWNPASIGFANQTEFEANIGLLGGWLIYDRRDYSEGGQPLGLPFESSSTSLIAPAPFFSVVSPLGTNRFRFGYATYFPGGGVADYPETGSQRYDIIDGYFVPWQHQFTVAFSPNPRWSFAVAGIYSAAFMKANLDIDLAPFISEMLGGSKIDVENPALASRSEVKGGVAHAFGAAFGVLYRPNVQWSFGASFHLPLTHTFESDMDLHVPRVVRALGAAPMALGLEDKVSSRASFQFDTPAFVNFGFRFQPFGYWTGEYFGRYAFSSHSRFMSMKFSASPLKAMEDTNLPGSKAQDAWLAGTTQSFQLWRPFTLGLTTFYGNSAVNDRNISPSRVGFDQWMVGGFARYKWTDSFRVGLEYSHYFLFERNIKSAQNPQSNLDVFQKADPNGRYRAGLDRLGVSVLYEF